MKTGVTSNTATCPNQGEWINQYKSILIKPTQGFPLAGHWTRYIVVSSSIIPITILPYQRYAFWYTNHEHNGKFTFWVASVSLGWCSIYTHKMYYTKNMSYVMKIIYPILVFHGHKILPLRKLFRNHQLAGQVVCNNGKQGCINNSYTAFDRGIRVE